MGLSTSLAKAIGQALVKKTNYTATTAFLALTTTLLEKKTTAKEIDEKAPKTTDGWLHKQIDTIEWEEVIEGTEGESDKVVFKNKNAIEWTPPVTAGEYTLKGVAIVPKKSGENEANTNNVLIGKLTTQVTINSATTTLKFAPKELKVEIT